MHRLQRGCCELPKASTGSPRATTSSAKPARSLLSTTSSQSPASVSRGARSSIQCNRSPSERLPYFALRELWARATSVPAHTRQHPEHEDSAQPPTPIIAESDRAPVVMSRDQTPPRFLIAGRNRGRHLQID